MKTLKKQYDIGYAVLCESDIKAGHFETCMDVNYGKQLLIFSDKKSAEQCIKKAKNAGINTEKEIVRKVKVLIF